MKQILVPIVTIGLVAMLAAGTFAYFTDTETSAGNNFTAGTLDLTTCHNTFVIEGIQPSYTGHTGTSSYNNRIGIELYHNIGTCDGRAYVTITNISNTEGENPESETNTAEPGDLGDHLVITKFVWGTSFWPTTVPSYVTDIINTIEVNKTLNEIKDTPYLLGNLPSGKKYYAEMYWELPAGTGNDCQGDVVVFDWKLDLDQIEAPDRT